MKTNRMWCATTLLCLSLVLWFVDCDKSTQLYPTAVDTAVESRALSKNGVAVSVSSSADVIVNATSDIVDFAGVQEIGDLPGPDGLVTLREAIIAANNSSGPQVIGFNIPIADPGFDGVAFTIRPLSPLPGLWSGGTTINGATQSEFSGDTNEKGPEIVIDGSLLDPTVEITGLDVGSAFNWIHGLVVCGFSNGIDICGESSIGNVVTGCFIGTDVSGMSARPNRQYGITSRFGASNTRIGGYGEEDRNLISGTPHVGVFLEAETHDVIVQGNLIGTDITGKYSIGNGSGIFCKANISQIFILGNLVSGNTGDGMTITNGIVNMQIQGNLIGSDINGEPVLGNAACGLNFGAGDPLPPSHDILVGGSLASEGNLIVDNGWGGIAIGGVAERIRVIGNTIYENHGFGVLIDSPGLGNTIQCNRIFLNEALGIDLSGDGVTLNDTGDIDSGPNNLMNFPVLISAKAAPGKLIVHGTVDTPNPKTVVIEFFANPVPTPGGDPSGFGEGAIFLGTAKPNPQGKFTAILPAVTKGTLISATATDANGSTSEFAATIEAER